MSRQPEEQNQLVSFEETPDTPPLPDIGINIRVAPPQAKAGEPVILSAAYNADGDLLRRCQSALGSCIKMRVVEIGDDPARFDRTLPLLIPLDDIMPPPAGEYGPHYREGGQFQLDIRTFFELPAHHSRYSITVSIGPYRTGPEPFEILP
jgi:hypothetical protein